MRFYRGGGWAIAKAEHGPTFPPRRVGPFMDPQPDAVSHLPTPSRPAPLLADKRAAVNGPMSTVTVDTMVRVTQALMPDAALLQVVL